MKKILIALGVIIILIAGAIWTYLLFNEKPASISEVFGRFTEAPERPGYDGEEYDPTVDTGNGGANATDESSRKRLYPLTTRPVAGAIIVGNTVRYVERGTGHIYEIGLQGGSERILSGTTLQRTIRASFSPKGDQVALTSEQGNELETVLGTLVSGGLEITTLPPGAREASFGSTGESLNFFVPTTEGGVGYTYTIKTKVVSEVFSIPLSAVRVLWGTPNYVYTTPSANALGYVYRMQKNTMEYVSEGKKGLMAYAHASGTLISSLNDDGILMTRDVMHGDIPILKLFPEKCTSEKQGSRVVLCASPLLMPTGATYPDDWYKGIIKFSDTILRVDSSSTTVQVISDLEGESGRPIDVLSIGTDTTGELVYFINKYDGALWMLDLRGETGGREQVYE